MPATDAFRSVARISRRVAPQSGAIASVPIRIARNVVPHMRHMPANAAY